MSAKLVAHAEAAGRHLLSIHQHRHVLARVIGAGPGWVAAVVGRQDQHVVLAQQRVQIRQPRVEILERRRVTGHLAPVPEVLVEVDEVRHHQAEVRCLARGRQRRVPQAVQAVGLDLPRHAHPGVDIRDLADRDHLPARARELVEHGGRRRRHRQVAAIAGAGEVVRRVAHEGPRDHAADVVGIHLLAGDLAEAVEPLEAEAAFVAGDLEHRVGRGIEDRLAGGDVLGTERGDDVGARGMAVAEVARQAPAPHDRVEQRRRERGLALAEITPVEAHRHAGHLPVAGRRVLARGALARGAVGTEHRRRRRHPCRQRAAGQLARQPDAEPFEMRHAQRSATAGLALAAAGRAMLGDMPEGVRTLVAEAFGIGRRADAERIENQN